MGSLLGLLVLSALAATAPGTSASPPTAQSGDALLQYVAPFQPLAGISYGMTAVDDQPLVLDQKVGTRVASGFRTVWYSCPSEPRQPIGSHLGFDFKASRIYELVCRDGQQAEIRAAGC